VILNLGNPWFLLKSGMKQTEIMLKYLIFSVSNWAFGTASCPIYILGKNLNDKYHKRSQIKYFHQQLLLITLLLKIKKYILFQYLERRFDKKVRFIASLLFVVHLVSTKRFISTFLV
jgi:hypothetical protein